MTLINTYQLQQTQNYYEKDEVFKFKIDSTVLEITDFLNYLSDKADIKDLEIDNETLDNVIINIYSKSH